MQAAISDLIGYGIRATDGDLGKLRDYEAFLLGHFRQSMQKKNDRD